MPLTDKACKNAKPGDKPYKMADGGGLYLLVHPRGARYWRVDYRFAGKRRTLAVGVYPDVGLREAREAREAAKKKIAAGLDPSTQKRIAVDERQEAQANTFGRIADEYLAKLRSEKLADTTLAKNTWLLKTLATDLTDRPIGEIEAPELLGVLRKIEARGRYESANRLRSICGSLFRYAIATGRAERDVAADLKGALTAPPVEHYPAIVEPKALGLLLRQIDDYGGYPAARAALQLMPIVFMRPHLLRSARWEEFDWEEGLWRVSAQKMKMRRAHLTPLPRQAIAIVSGMKSLTGDGPYVFPSTRSAHKPMSENTLNAALRGMGYTKEQVCAHGFRTTASTLLHEQGWPSEWVEKQLAHKDRNKIRDIYNAAEYLPERRRMMQAWADYLDQLKVE